MYRTKEEIQIVIKLTGRNHDLLEKLLEALEEIGNGINSPIMSSDKGGYHAFATIFGMSQDYEDTHIPYAGEVEATKSLAEFDRLERDVVETFE